MNKDDVIRLARQVNNTPFDAYTTPELFGSKQIMAFAKLVAEHEREQIIAITATQEFSRMYGEFTPSAYDLVKAIRARGQA